MTEESMVERVARALWEDEFPDEAWEGVPEFEKENYGRGYHAMIDAALGMS